VAEPIDVLIVDDDPLVVGLMIRAFRETPTIEPFPAHNVKDTMFFGGLDVCAIAVVAG